MQELFTVKEVAKMFRTNVDYIYKLINNGELKAVKIGSLKITSNAISSFIENKERTTK